MVLRRVAGISRSVMITRECGRFVSYIAERLPVSYSDLIMSVLYCFMAIPSVLVNRHQHTTWRKHIPIGQSICGLAVSVLYRRKMMNRYEQRRRKLLQNEEVAAGYQEMAAELELMHAIDEVRKQLDMSQEQLAKRMGKKREAVSRLLSADDINPTLNTLIELLSALNLTADITLRQTREGEGPIKVATEIAPSK